MLASKVQGRSSTSLNAFVHCGDGLFADPDEDHVGLDLTHEIMTVYVMASISVFLIRKNYVTKRLAAG